MRPCALLSCAQYMHISLGTHSLTRSPVCSQKMLPHDVMARRNFVQSGGLQYIQELAEAHGGELASIVEEINKCFPAEIVQYYSPGYSKTLMDKIDEFTPSFK